MHFDETHYATDVQWCHSPLSADDRSTFLRRHTHVHPKLEPALGWITNWEDEPPPHVATGHPMLHALIVGAMHCAFTGGVAMPQETTVHNVRVFNAAFDSATIVLLSPFVTAIGGGAAAGLLAAWLYAVFPAAAAYGSLAYLDPLLPPLFVGLLIVLARAKRELPLWLLAGVLSALLVSTKPTGLLALLIVPAIGRLWCRAGLRELAVWAASFAMVTVALGDPIDYVRGILDPVDPSAEIPLNPLETLRAHFVYLIDFGRHYWLGFAQHGRPLADVLARGHFAAGPVYFGTFAAAAVFSVATRQRGALLFCLMPIVPALFLFPPSNGLWRFQILFPLVCATIAFAISVAGTKYRIGFAAVAIACASIAFAPLAPDRETGTLALHKIIFRNPDVPQKRQLFNPFRGRPFELLIPAGSSMEHPLWLSAGSYRMTAWADGDVGASIDGRKISTARDETFEVEGRMHRLRLESRTGASIRRLTITPDG